jgi:hypothetical protein
VDLSKLTTADKLIIGGGLAYLIFMFLPWYGVEDFTDASNSGWDYFLGGIIPLLIILVMVAQIVVTKFSDTELPSPPVPWSQVHLIAGVAVAIILLLRLLIGSDVEVFGEDFDLERKYGLFLAVIAAIVVAVGGFLKSQDPDVTPTVGDGPGSAPF